MNDPVPLPHSPELEERLVASVLETPKLYPDVPVTLTPDKFYMPRPRMVWAGIQRCVERGLAITDADVLDAIREAMGAERWLRERHTVDAYLRSLYQVATTAMVARDAQRILGRAARRKMIAVAKQIFAEGQADQSDDETFLHEAQGLVLGAAQESAARADDTCEPMRDIVRDVFKRIEDDSKANRRGGIRSGLPHLDALTLGWRPGKLVIVGARPGMGKSAIMNTFAIEGTFEQDSDEAVASLVISAEMPRSEVAIRAVSSEARFDGRRLQEARIHPGDWKGITEACATVSDLPMWVDDRPRPTLEHIRSRIRRLNHKLSNETRSFEVVEYGVSRIVEKPLRVQLVVVDYLQIMGVRKDRSRSREQEITELADGLKALAKEERCCVVALAQLNRDVEKRPNKRPMLSDLRESGGIEQAADAILLLYRDEYYDKESKAKGLAEINVAKMRGGKTGRVVARFEPQFTRFTAIEDKDLPEALEACEFTPNEIKEGQEET